MYIEDKAHGESLEGFIKFLESKNPQESYVWTNSNECACAQYLHSIGEFREMWLNHRNTTMCELNQIAGGGIHEGTHSSEKWTFGQCLDRAKKVMENA